MAGTAVVVGGIEVRGLDVDSETRCTHYDDERDVIAIRFRCCDEYYPCYRCHEALADHDPAVHPREAFSEPAVLCGACGTELSVAGYLDCGFDCPACDAAFNPGCRRHYDRYFEI